MPIFVVDDNRFLVGVALSTCFKNGIGFFGDALVEFFAVFVVLVDIFCFVVGIGYVSCNKQFNGVSATLHAS